MDFQAFLITLRECLEAVLIVGLILGYLDRLNAPQYKKWVYAGVGLALLASLGVAFLFQVVFTSFASFGSDTYLRLGIMMVSVLLLTHMVLWMGKEAKENQQASQAKVAAAISTGSAITMIIHSFLVIVREGIETVFFFAAISGGEIEKVLTSYGAVSGLLLALIFGYLFVSGSMKIPVKRFFQVTGVLILFIAAGMLVQTIGRFQDLGLLGSLLMNADGTPAAVYNIVGFMPEHYIDQVQYLRDTGNSTLISGQIGTFMGAMFGYSHNPSLEQVVAWWGYFAFAGWMLLRQNKPSKSSKSLQEVS